MDINGAKALKKRLGSNETSEVTAMPTPSDADVCEDAPPVYHWLGVPRAAAATSDAEDDPAPPSTSFFRRLGLSFR